MGLDEILRSRASSRVRRRAAAIAQEHTRLVDRRARPMFAANPDAELLLAHERAQENDIAIQSLYLLHMSNRFHPHAFLIATVEQLTSLHPT